MLSIQKNLTKSFYALLSLPATAMGFALSIQISALSWILSTKYGLDIHDVGLVWAAGPIAGILGQVLIGVLSDNVWLWNGRRRPFILIGGVLAALMLLALPNIDVISSAMGFEGILGVAIAVALTLDLAINVSFNPTRSVIADVTPEGRERTKGYTWMQTISGTFGMMAYVIGVAWDNYILIYSGAILVFLLSIIPPFFIKEPRELNSSPSDDDEEPQKHSALDMLKAIEPLWGFLVYGIYAITMRLIIGGHTDHEAQSWLATYWMEMLCLLITIGLIVKVLLQSEDGKTRSEAGMIGFKKVLAAHSFTWIGIQTMFVYMFAFVQYEIYGMVDGETMAADVNVEMGKIVSFSFLILNGIAAILPILVLQPLTRRWGRTRTHAVAIASMAVAYFAMIWVEGMPVSTINIGGSVIPFHMIYVVMLFLGIGWSATISLPFAIMSQKVDQSRMGLYMGLFNLSVVLPQLVASIGVGAAISNAEDKSIIFIIAGITLAISALAWFMVSDDNEEEEEQADPMMGGGGH